MKYLEIKNGVLKEYTEEDTVLSIPECVKRIDGGAFRYARILMTLYIPSTVEIIEKGTLYTYGELKDVYFAEGFEKIDPDIFGYGQLDNTIVHLSKSCKSFPVKTVEADLPKIVWAAGKVTWVITNERTNSNAVFCNSRWVIQLLIPL